MTAPKTQLPKNYDPAAVESAAYGVWLDENCFHAEASDPGEPYCIVIPPPNVTGALHLGHAINNTLQDILIRHARMHGKNALWIPGIDHAGIATQAVVEKQLKEIENKTRHDVGREGLVERIWAWKQQYGDRILAQLQRLGCSCDWDRARFTLDDQCARAVREVFFKLFKDGLVYRGKRLVNWDTHLQTSISDDEIYHEKVKTFLWHIKYPINAAPAGRPDHLVVATTRPETMLGDTAVAVNSQDPRWNWAIGHTIRLPLTGRTIPIIADDVLVDAKFGTGCVKVTPAHDPNDYAVWQRHQGQPDQIDILNILNPDGTLNDNAGAYQGLRTNKAREQVVADLESHGLLAKVEPYETDIGHSDRSKTAIQPYLSDQWFVKMAPLAEPALQVVRGGTVKFFPERHAQQYLSWLGEKRDWPISRQLWWGHRIPIWHKRLTPDLNNEQWWMAISVSDLNEMATDDPEFAVQITDATTGEVLSRSGEEMDRFRGRDVNVYICKRRGDWNTDFEQHLEELGFTQDPDVLDTWFSSALWPHSTLGWPDKTPELAKWNPTSVLVTARDIITLWVARMVMLNLYNLGSIPFPHVAINPTILDGKGERMSKSKGNGVDPVDVIDTHGADALRFTLATMATETQDVRMPVKKDDKGRNTSDKFDFGRNFANKLWNASRFVLANLAELPTTGTSFPPAPGASAGSLSLADVWILSRLNDAVAAADAAISVYRFDQYAKVCYEFVWGDLCDWYVEASKPAMKDPARATVTADVLASVLDASLRLLHPVVPFVTETIWWQLNDVRPIRGIPGVLECPPSPRLIRAAWPKPAIRGGGAVSRFAAVQAIVTAIRNVRNEHKADPKKQLPVTLIAPADFAWLAGDDARPVIETLAGCKLVAGTEPPPAATRAAAAGCELYLEGLVDPAAEQQRIEKKRQDLAKQIAQLKARLSNEAYISKAPPKLVEETQQQLAAAEAELTKL